MKFRILFSTLFSLFILAALTAQDSDGAEASATSLYNDGIAAIKAKDYQTALDKFTAALEKADPEADEKVIKLSKKNGANAAYAVANKKMKADDLEGALALFEKGIELNDKSYLCAYGKAKVLGEQKSDDALNAYFDAADLAIAAGKEDKAKDYVDRAGKIVSKAYFDKEYESAVANGTKLIERMDDAGVRYYLAKSLIKLNNGSEAIPHAEKAKELGGSEDEGKYIMVYAEALEASGDMTAAKKAFAEVPQGKYYEVAQYKVNQK